jgi:hypothetical protein
MLSTGVVVGSVGGAMHASKKIEKNHDVNRGLSGLRAETRLRLTCSYSMAHVGENLFVALRRKTRRRKFTKTF